MKIPSPGELGLPEKFDAWRPQQEEALNVIVTSKKRETVVCAPTGSGKTGMAVGCQRITGEPTLIITANNGLLHQYLDEFKSVGMVALMGKRNYPCQLREDYTCEEGTAASCPYVGSVSCGYSKAVIQAGRSDLIVSNYAKLTSERRPYLGFPHIRRVIFDEAHECPDAIASAVQVILRPKEIEETLKVPFPAGSHAEDMREWKSWAKFAKIVAEDEKMAALARITGVTSPKTTWVRHYTHMVNLCRRLGTLSVCSPDNWVVDTTNDGYQFDPIWPGLYAESTLLFKAPKIVLMSATINPKTLYMMGQGESAFTFLELDSDFDVTRAPIYYIPVMRIDSKADDLSPVWLKIDQIIGARQGVKGIIQTFSFQRQMDVLVASRFSDNMLYNKRGEITSELVEKFRGSDLGSIMVSPSIGTGYDFPDDLCRYNILPKIPIEPPSKIQKARDEVDKEYRKYRTVQYMVQAFGRHIRSKSDWGEGFILDAHMEWFWPSSKHLAPKSFRKFLLKRNTLPQPLRLAA